MSSFTRKYIQFLKCRDLSYNALELPQMTYNLSLDSLVLLDVRGNHLLTHALVDFLMNVPKTSVRVDKGAVCCVIEMKWEEEGFHFNRLISGKDRHKYICVYII